MLVRDDFPKFGANLNMVKKREDSNGKEIVRERRGVREKRSEGEEE